MKCAKAIAIAVLVMVIGLQSAHADQIFHGGFFDHYGNSGDFSLLAVHDNGNQWTAISGTLTVISGSDAGVYALYSLGDNPGSIGQYSPTGNFYFNNNFYYPGAELILDTGGLLFVNDGFGAAGVAEVSLWGPMSPPSSGNYSFWSSGRSMAEYLTTSDTASVFIVPEPSTVSIWLALFGTTASIRCVRRSNSSSSTVV